MFTRQSDLSLAELICSASDLPNDVKDETPFRDSLGEVSTHVHKEFVQKHFQLSLVDAWYTFVDSCIYEYRHSVHKQDRERVGALQNKVNRTKWLYFTINKNKLNLFITWLMMIKGLIKHQKCAI